MLCCVDLVQEIQDLNLKSQNVRVLIKKNQLFTDLGQTNSGMCSCMSGKPGAAVQSNLVDCSRFHPNGSLCGSQTWPNRATPQAIAIRFCSIVFKVKISSTMGTNFHGENVCPANPLGAYPQHLLFVNLHRFMAI